MDEKLQTLLNNQVISEYGASMVYTQLAFEMDNLSFPGMRAAVVRNTPKATWVDIIAAPTMRKSARIKSVMAQKALRCVDIEAILPRHCSAVGGLL